MPLPFVRQLPARLKCSDLADRGASTCWKEAWIRWKIIYKTPVSLSPYRLALHFLSSPEVSRTVKPGKPLWCAVSDQKTSGPTRTNDYGHRLAQTEMLIPRRPRKWVRRG